MSRDEIIPPTLEWIKQHAGMVEVVLDDKGNVKHAQKVDQSVLAYLIKQEVLDQTHAHYALVYSDMRNCFRRKLSSYSNSIYAAEFFGSDISNGMFETLYLRVCRMMMGKPEHCVRFAIDTDATNAHRQMAWENRHAIAGAFDKLVESIDQARKEAEDQKTVAQSGYS